MHSIAMILTYFTFKLLPWVFLVLPFTRFSRDLIVFLAGMSEKAVEELVTDFLQLKGLNDVGLQLTLSTDTKPAKVGHLRPIVD